MKISQDHVDEVKKQLKIYHSHSDDRLKSFLESSYLFIKSKCGDFNIEENNMGTELMYSRVRYMNDDALEYFDDNFKSMMIHFALKNRGALNENTEQSTL